MADLLVKISVDDRGNMAIRNLGKSAQFAQKSAVSLGETFRKAFAIIGAYRGIDALVVSFSNAVREALKYENAMKKVQAIGNENAATMRTLDQEITNYALQSEHSFSAIAEAQLELTKAGVRGTESIQLLTNALDLATISGEGARESTEGLLSIMNMFNIPFSESARVANIIGNTLNATLVDLKDYLETMKYAAPIAAQLNISFEELSATIGMLSQVGQKGSLAGTGLRNAMLQLLKVTPEVAAHFNKMEFSGKSLVDILKMMHEAGIPVIQFLDQFNKRGLPVAIAAGKQGEAIKKLQEDLQNLDRPVNVVADEIRKSLLNQLKILENNIINVANELNKALGKDSRVLIENISLQFKKLAIGISENKDNLSKLSGVLGNIISVMVSNWEVWVAFFAAEKITAATKALNSFTRSLGGVGLALTRANPYIWAAVAAYTALDAVFDMLNKKLATINKNITENFVSEQHVRDLNKVIDAYYKVLGRDEYPEGTTIESLMIKGKDASELIKAMKEFKAVWGDFDIKNLLSDPTAIRNLVNLRNNIVTMLNATPPSAEKETTGGKKTTGGKTFGDFVAVDTEEVKNKIDEYERLIENELSRSLKKEFEIWDKAIEKREQLQDKLNKDPYASEKKYIRSLYDFLEENINNLPQHLYDQLMDLLIKYEKEMNIRTYLEESLGTFETYAGVFSDVHNSIMDMVQSRWQYVHAQRMKMYDDEMKKLEERYDKEVAAAGDSVIQRSILENNYMKEKQKIEAKMNEEKKKAAQKEFVANMLNIALNGATMASNFVTQLSARMNPYAAIALGVGLAAGITTAQLAVAAANNPAKAYVHGGKVRDIGNSTSDSVNARLSAGEWVLSRDDVDRLGGDSVIQRMITIGDTSNNGSNVVIHIDTIIGDETYIRKNIIPKIKEELRR